MGNKSKLDGIDLTILRHLKQNSRIHFLEMARQTNIPDATIQSRVKRLEKRGIIEKFTITVNPSAIGLTVAAFMLVKVDADKQDTAKAALSRISEISEIYGVLGEYDLCIKVRSKSLEELNDLINDKIRSIEGIEDLLEIVIVERVKEDSVPI
jgi:Lrp/AsnC family transcriptional regulator for asnA, asnC and gidA